MDKKIGIGINIFGKFHRQDLCIESLRRIKSILPDVVELYNIQQLGQPITEHPDFITIYDKGRTAANTIPDGTSNLPMVRDMFDALAEQGHKHFMFLNSDIILTERAIDSFLRHGYVAWCCSRLAIENIESLSDTNITHSHLQIAGFDAYAITSKWWLENKHDFPDYVYAISAWDVDYASRLAVLLQGNCRFLNSTPAPCYHIMHEEKSHNDTPERAHNMNLFFNINKPLCDAWHKFLFKILELRTPLNSNYTTAHQAESGVKAAILHDPDLYTQCFNRS